MKIKEKTKSKRIIEALIKDGAGYIIGLPFGFPVPLPLDTMLTIGKIIRERSPFNYVDWELRDWIIVYHKEIDSTVRISYFGKKYLLPQVLYFSNIKHKLELAQIKFQIEWQPFELSEEIRALTEKAFERLSRALNFYNDQNLRLMDIAKRDGEIILVVQPVEYQYYIHTNLVLDARIGKSQTLRERLHPDGKLEKLSESPLANNLGINILLFTADGTLILQKRSRKVAFRRGQLCPSASGTVCLNDVPVNLITLAQMPKLREAFEEMGIKKEDVTEMFFLGITRELIRGGEPEMFFFALTRLSEKDVRERWELARDKWETKKLVFYNFGNIGLELDDDYKRHEFLCKVDDFLTRFIDHASVTLLTAIALWSEYRLQRG